MITARKALWQYLVVSLAVSLFLLSANSAEATIETVYMEADSVLSLNEPNKHIACSMYGDIGSWDAYGGHAYRYIAKANLNGIATDPTKIIKATFNIDRVSNSWDDNNNYVLQRVTAPWTDSGVTWGNQPGRDPGTTAPTGPVYGIFRFDITQTVKNWLSNPSSNNGVIIKKVNEDLTLGSNKGSFACASYSSSGAESRPTITIESCTEDEWTCGSWGTCSQSGTQTRACSKSVDCPGTDTPASPETSESCTPPSAPTTPTNPPPTSPTTPTNPPATTCSNDTWTCSDWSSCSSGGRQTRNCNKTYDCSSAETPAPEVSQSCQAPTQPTIPPATCSADTWTCSDWSTCSSNGRQTRNCNKTYDCSSAETPSPEVSQSCQAPTNPTVPTQPSTPTAPTEPTAPADNSCASDTWTCGDWGVCSLSGVQGRSCTRSYNCPNAETPPPETYQYCSAPVQPKPVDPNSPDAAANQDTIVKATVKLVCPVSDTMASQGSGTIIDSAGTILTNRHVINQTAGCFVGFITNYSDEPFFSPEQIADIVNVSADQDIAILKMHNPLNKALPYINITTGQSANLTLGSKITTYGYPARFGTNLTYTSGDFSGTVPGFLKTTAIIEHGNSGGGAYTQAGSFIGMPTAVVKGELNALGYILAIDNIKAWIDNKPLVYNPGTDNNYSRVRQILESYSTNKLPALKLAINTKPTVTTPKNTKAVPAAVPDKVEPIKQATEEKKVQTDQYSASLKPATNNSSPVGLDNPIGTAKEGWFKRLLRWVKNLF